MIFNYEKISEAFVHLASENGTLRVNDSVLDGAKGK